MVSSDKSGVGVLVISANEELVIARGTVRLVQNGETAKRH
jgi:acetate kinase